MNSPHTQHDEFDYIEPPITSQVADHHDDDHDGVINERDLCLETPNGAEVDNDGCSKYFMTPASMDLRILFANNSDEINPIFSDNIIELAEFLKEYPNTSLEIEGYASLTGNPQHNIDLSKRRAENVRQALIGYGIDAERLKVIGFGSAKLSTEGIDERSHALNRRVVASVVGEKNQVLLEWTIFTTFPKS
ncbi:OmpA family protein [Vibrio sagamiensis]|uniref:OmpA family protein n=1 Tax=Vibrio sagamiensis TaxID=512650 RepID=UPI0006ACD75D|nr:OmpA family protein [Vibrio sagamiensis]